MWFRLFSVVISSYLIFFWQACALLQYNSDWAWNRFMNECIMKLDEHWVHISKRNTHTHKTILYYKIAMKRNFYIFFSFSGNILNTNSKQSKRKPVLKKIGIFIVIHLTLNLSSKYKNEINKQTELQTIQTHESIYSDKKHI